MIAIILLFCLFSESYQGLHEERLISDLFRNYQRHARPVSDESEAVIVKFGMSLQSIVDVDEKNEMLQTNMWLDYEWYDWKLQWNDSEYGGVKSIRLPSSEIWTPDILMYNSADEDIDSKFPTNVVVSSTGQLSWVPIGLFISSCSIDIKWFPFDEQKCDMKFGSWSYDGSKINLTLKYDEIDISTYKSSGEWGLTGYPATRNIFKYDCCPAPYIDTTFTIKIRRRALYYGFNLILPCFLISALTLVTFFLPPETCEKISLGITILLSLSVFSLIVAEAVPSTSLAVPMLGLYFTSVMVLCSLSVMTTCLALNFHHRNPDMCEMPDWVRRLFCERLACWMRMARPGRDTSRKSLLQKGDMRNLRDSQSMSLLANIRDIDTGIAISEAPPASRVYLAPDVESADKFNKVKKEILAILNEVRYMTHQLKDDSDANDEMNDWKFAAMVIDRFCAYVFTVLLIVTTVAIFVAVPGIFMGDAGI